MKIAACLAWFDEDPEALARLVLSLEGVADVLVHLDGCWQGTPTNGQGHRSPREQEDAILEAAISVGIPIVSKTPMDVYQSQVAKRERLMHMALVTDADFLLVVDADEYVSHAYPGKLRQTLTETEHDVALVLLRNVHHDTTYTGAIRRLYRASTGVHVPGPAHNAYMTDKAHGSRWLHGDPAYVQLEPPEQATATLLTLNHDSSSRSEKRQEARTAYRLMRQATRLEAWKAAP